VARGALQTKIGLMRGERGSVDSGGGANDFNDAGVAGDWLTQGPH
jgi:hypothetical protein